MDIRCTSCGEPWDTDVLHDLATEDEITYDQAYAEFRKYGCIALSSRHSSNTADPAIAELADLMGDDIDGLAGLLEDFGLDYE